MSLRYRDRRKQLFARASEREELRRDWSARRKPGRRRIVWAPLFVVLVLSLLSLAALRISILRTRYALGATLQHETELRTRERSVAVAVRIERDPHRLRELAARQGFTRPERVLDLADEARAR
jgi:hypothetical protein